MDQWNRIDPHKYSQLIFDKGARAVVQRQSPKQMVLEKLDIRVQKNNNIDTDLTPFIKIHSK